MKNYSLVRRLWIIILPFAVSAQLRSPENVPISFFGKVVDQDNKPIEAAKVNLEIIVAHFAQDLAEKAPMSFSTDKDGNFTIHGIIGHAVDISSIQKDGYELSPKIQRDYSYTLPADMTNPDSARACT